MYSEGSVARCLSHGKYSVTPVCFCHGRIHIELGVSRFRACTLEPVEDVVFYDVACGKTGDGFELFTVTEHFLIASGG